MFPWISGRGYWQELIESIRLGHKTKLRVGSSDFSHGR